MTHVPEGCKLLSKRRAPAYETNQFFRHGGCHNRTEAQWNPCVQEWHYHTRIDECLLITKGVLTCRWLEDGAERTRKVREQEIVRVGSSVHTFANETEEDVEFVVFRFVPDGRDKRETIKNDKVVVDR